MSHMHKYFLVLFLCVVGGLQLSAKIEWLSKDYNYGVFKESDGPRDGSVSFVNKGPEAVFINRVRPGCGCTEAEFTQGIIEPGDTATVRFTYNPKGRPGSFDKAIKVFVGKENEVHVIRLRGTVVGSESTLSMTYPKEVGPLRLESYTATTGELKKGSSRHLFINAYNQSMDTITPSWTGEERGLRVELTPAAIPPGDVATFGFYLKTTEEERVGPVDYKVLLTADSIHPDSGRCEITISTIIVPDTSMTTLKEIEKGPSAYLLPEFIDLGEIPEKGKVDFVLDILNDGEIILSVMSVYSTDKNIEIKDVPSEVKSGKTAKVKGVVLLDNIASGAFRIPLEVITNDPLHPIRTAYLIGIKS